MSEAFTPRQQQVLTAALEILVETGDALTMTAVARRARCSKETLYNWFGGRDGLLTATVQWQAAKVRVPAVSAASLDRATLRASLNEFARDLLTTISGEVSITLNRLSITHARPAGAGLGAIMLEHGPAAIRRRAAPLLEAGREAGLLKFDSAEDAYRTFFGLVVRDLQIRLLLGEPVRMQAPDISTMAATATDQFFTLYSGARH